MVCYARLKDLFLTTLRNSGGERERDGERHRTGRSGSSRYLKIENKMKVRK